jgi:transposase
MGSGPLQQELLGRAIPISKRRGPKRAGIAVVHSILVIAYHMLCNGVDFNDLGADYFDRINTAKLRRYHLRRLAELGCDVGALAVSA